MKKISVIMALFLVLGLLAGCSGNTSAPGSDVTGIVLSDDGIKVTGGGAKAAGNTVTVSALGTYSVSGKLSDGQIIVDTGDEAVKVTLILNGVDITNLSGPAIHIRQAKNAHVELAEGTENKLTSGRDTDMDLNNADSSGAALYAEDDLDIDGPGSLTVLGYINNGIACKNDLDINGGSISVLSANNGIRGNDSVDIKGGDIAVTAGGDGIKTTKGNKAGKGAVTVSGGTLSVRAVGDGISAETELKIEAGAVFVSTDGDPDQVSSKALKAQTGLVISGGSLTLDATDHAIHSGAAISITGGTVIANSASGKAIAAHGDVAIDGGELRLGSEKDGIETPENITISGGSLMLTAGDDGLQAGEANTGRGTVAIKGGQVQISASGQAVNARGQLVLDGGTFIGLGNSGKVPVPTGSQRFMSIGWTGAAGNEFTVADEQGAPIASTAAYWPFKTVLVSSPALVAGENYTLTNGANSTTARCPEQ